MIRQILEVARKDLLVEWKSPVRVSGLFFFALTLLLVVAFATGADPVTLRRIAGGALWLGLLLASTRSLDLSFTIESQTGAMTGMVLWPVDPRAIFYGKALANTVVLAVVAAALTPMTIALYDAPIQGDPLLFLAFLVAGCAGLAAPGTLYALLTSRARASSVLLPLLLFPVWVPMIIAAATGTTVLFEGDPMRQAPSWLGLLLAFDLIHWSLDGLLFAVVVEDR